MGGSHLETAREERHCVDEVARTAVIRVARVPSHASGPRNFNLPAWRRSSVDAYGEMG